MLVLDLHRLMEPRGIQNPRHFLVKSGFTYHAATRLLNGTLAGTRFIEELCIVMNCTPNDLFNWIPDQDVKSVKTMALSKLAGRKHKGNIMRKLKDLPENKIEELHSFLDTLTNPE